MATDLTVDQVVTQGPDWSNDYGTFRPFELKLSGPGAPNSTVQLSRKLVNGAVPEDKVPKEGQTLYLSINGTRAKEERKDSQPFQTPANGSGEDQYARRPEHPQNAARMARSKALELAPRYYELFRTENAMGSAGPDLQAMKARLLEIATWLQADIDAAYVEPKNHTPAPQGAGGTLPTPPATTPVSADADIPFRPVI